MKKLLPIFLLALVACANPKVVQLGEDTYMLAKEDHAGIFGSMAKLKAEVIEEANSFAAARGKVAIPVSVREKPVGSKPADWAHFEYQFRLVDRGATAPVSMNTDRQSLAPRDAVIETTHNINVTTRENSVSKTDVYSELIKLDDLRKRKIISDAEFEVEKAKLLRNR